MCELIAVYQLSIQLLCRISIEQLFFPFGSLRHLLFAFFVHLGLEVQLRCLKLVCPARSLCESTSGLDHVLVDEIKRVALFTIAR